MGSKVILNREQELALEKILVEKRNVFVSGAGELVSLQSLMKSDVS